MLNVSRSYNNRRKQVCVLRQMCLYLSGVFTKPSFYMIQQLFSPLKSHDDIEASEALNSLFEFKLCFLRLFNVCFNKRFACKNG